MNKTVESRGDDKRAGRPSRWLVLGVVAAAAASGGCYPMTYTPCSGCAPDPSLVPGEQQTQSMSSYG